MTGLALASGDVLPAYIAAARAFASGDYASAAEQASTVVNDPLFEVDDNGRTLAEMSDSMSSFQRCAA